MGNIFN